MAFSSDPSNPFQVQPPRMAVSLTSAFNFKRSTPCFSPPSLSPPARRQAAAARVIRSEKKMYKGTQMRVRKLAEMIEKKVTEAKQACDGIEDECKVAWDEVEAISQAKADLRLKLHHLHQDPLEHFCFDNPDTDECEVYYED